MSVVRCEVCRIINGKFERTFEGDENLKAHGELHARMVQIEPDEMTKRCFPSSKLAFELSSSKPDSNIEKEIEITSLTSKNAEPILYKSLPYLLPIATLQVFWPVIRPLANRGSNEPYSKEFNRRVEILYQRIKTDLIAGKPIKCKGCGWERSGMPRRALSSMNYRCIIVHLLAKNHLNKVPITCAYCQKGIQSVRGGFIEDHIKRFHGEGKPTEFYDHRHLYEQELLDGWIDNFGGSFDDQQTSVPANNSNAQQPSESDEAESSEEDSQRRIGGVSTASRNGTKDPLENQQQCSPSSVLSTEDELNKLSIKEEMISAEESEAEEEAEAEAEPGNVDENVDPGKQGEIAAGSNLITDSIKQEPTTSQPETSSSQLSPLPATGQNHLVENYRIGTLKEYEKVLTDCKQRYVGRELTCEWDGRCRFRRRWSVWHVETHMRSHFNFYPYKCGGTCSRFFRQIKAFYDHQCDNPVLMVTVREKEMIEILEKCYPFNLSSKVDCSATSSSSGTGDNAAFTTAAGNEDDMKPPTSTTPTQYSASDEQMVVKSEVDPETAEFPPPPLPLPSLSQIPSLQTNPPTMFPGGMLGGFLKPMHHPLPPAFSIRPMHPTPPPGGINSAVSQSPGAKATMTAGGRGVVGGKPMAYMNELKRLVSYLLDKGMSPFCSECGPVFMIACPNNVVSPELLMVSIEVHILQKHLCQPGYLCGVCGAGEFDIMGHYQRYNHPLPLLYQDLRVQVEFALLEYLNLCFPYPVLVTAQQ